MALRHRLKELLLFAREPAVTRQSCRALPRRSTRHGILGAMSAENVQIVREALEPFSTLDVIEIDWGSNAIREALGASFAEDVELRTLESGAGSGVNSFYSGWDGLVSYLREWFEPFSEYHVEWLDFIDAGDHVLVPCTQWGIGASSGARVELELTHVYRVRDGRIDRVNQYDTLDEAREAVTTVADERSRDA
jgi:ketosteroid isomerase-like protein